MPCPVSWSERCCEGFALAATIAGDRGAVLADAGVCAAARQELSVLARALGELPKAERRARVRRLTQRAPLADHQAGRPARALGLLASQAPAEQARAWLSAAALPRPGFVAAPALLALLQRIATTESRS
jgi:hypothetical protein